MNVNQHLDELPCADASAFRALVRQLRSIPEVEPGDDLHMRIMAQVSQRRTRRHGGWGYGLTAAAVALLFFTLHTGRSDRLFDHPASKDLHWLAANQEADGTWSPIRHGGAESFRPALTALSILALRRESGRYAEQIGKGVARLTTVLANDATFSGPHAQADLYNLTITTFVLASGGATTPALKASVTRAVERIHALQRADGSWDYAATPEGNVGITAWMIRALDAAERNGIQAAHIPARRGLRWLRDRVREDGRVAYHLKAETSDALTAWIACVFLSAGDRSADLKRLGERMTRTFCLSADGSQPRDCYRDYAKILALESAGRFVSAEQIRAHMRKQERHDDQWARAGGRLYTTSVTALCRAD